MEISEICDRIRSRVDASHDLVLLRTLAHISESLETNFGMHCSYGSYMNAYAVAQVRRTQAKSKMNYYYRAPAEEDKIQAQLEYQEGQIAELSQLVYNNVCLACAPCQSRSKPWPSKTHFSCTASGTVKQSTYSAFDREPKAVTVLNGNVAERPLTEYLKATNIRGEKAILAQ